MGMTRTPAASCLRTLRERREGLVDRVEGSVDVVLETLVSREVFTRDDREEVLCERGPRGRVRKVLDILDCKGEEAAGTFLLALSHLRDVNAEVSEQSVVPTHTAEYSRVMQKHKAVLRRRSESLLFSNARHGEQVPFSLHYVNLLVVRGHHSLELRKHEVLTFGQRRLALQGTAPEKRLVKPAQLFANANANGNANNTGSRPPKRVLVTGVAGIGKTVLVQKILYDFGSNVEHVEFDFVLHLTFRDLNLVSKPVSFRDLALRKNSHLSKCVDAILANESKLLVVLDGFDEFKHYRSTADVDAFVTEPDEEGEVTEVISSLIQGELLPEASVLLTSRPMAISHVPVASINCFAVITGFSIAEIRDFFQRYFQEEALALQMFEKVAANELMLTLCYIPAFCHIVCSILKDSDGLARESPKTMTDIYTQYLVALLRSHSLGRVDDERTSERQRPREIVLKLASLAYEKLMAHETLFYSGDMEAVQSLDPAMVSAFLDKTSVQEPGFTEDVFSFTHLTVQEFFAALHCAVAGEVASPDVFFEHNNSSSRLQEDEITPGHLDLFDRFLSGLLSERNQRLLSRSVGLDSSATQAEVYREGLVKKLQALCESGEPILTQLHCLFEQQDDSLLLDFHPSTLRVKVSDVSLSPMDYAVIKHFLQQTTGTISELDLTGSSITATALTDLQPHLNRCRSLWLGENTLDMEAIQVIAQVLQSSDTLTYLGLGWTDIGDEEVLVLADAIRSRQSLREIWMEGNRVSYRGLLSLSALTPSPLQAVVAIWNEVSEEEASLLNGTSLDSRCVTVSFTDDLMWKEWCQWVLQRCQGNSTEKLVGVLHKVCRGSSVQRQDVPWTRSFYGELLKLIRSRIAACDEEEDEEVRRRLEKFASIVAS